MAEEMGVLSIDKTPDGAALKFSEKARVSPEKLATFMGQHEGAIFTPTGVLKLTLTEEQHEEVLKIVRDVLLELRTSD